MRTKIVIKPNLSLSETENAQVIFAPGDIIKCVFPIFARIGSAYDLSHPEWAPEIDILVRPDTLLVVIRQLVYDHPIAGYPATPGQFLTMSCMGFVWVSGTDAFKLL